MIKVNSKWLPYILLFLAALLLFCKLGSWGVIETSEARYAEISWEMFCSGNYSHPTLLNIGHYHKPPLTYIITAISYNLFGATPFAARFFLQVAVLIQLVLIYNLTKKLFGNYQIALLASFIYFTFPVVILSARGLTTDAYLNTFVLGAVWSYISYRKNGHYHSLYLAAILMGFGFLTKGPVVLIIPAVVFICCNVFRPFGIKRVWSYHHVFINLVFLTISASWFVMLYLENAKFLDYFVIDHTLKRYVTNKFGRHEPFWYYILLIPATTLPWIIITFNKLKNALLNRFSLSKEEAVLSYWILLPLLFFSLSQSKLILYVLPIYPAIAILAAKTLYDLSSKHITKFNIIAFTYAILIVLALITLGLVVPTVHYSATMFILLALALLIILVIQKKIKQKLKSVLLTLGLTITTLILISNMFMQLNPLTTNSTLPVTQFIEAHNPYNAPVIALDERLPSLAFNMKQEIISAYFIDDELNREVQFEANSNWKANFIDLNHAEGLSRFKALITQGCFIVVKNKWPKGLSTQPNSGYAVHNFGKWVVYYPLK